MILEYEKILVKRSESTVFFWCRLVTVAYNIVDKKWGFGHIYNQHCETSL